MICLCLNPSDGESLANFHFEFFNFELREFWQQDIGSWGCGLVWLMFCKEALTPSDIPMCDLFWRGIPCKFLFCTFHVGIGRRFRWHEAFVWVIKPAQAPYPSDMPTKGESLAIFLFCILQSGIERIWQEASQEVAVGPVDVPRGDVYNLCLTPPMFTSCI